MPNTNEFAFADITIVMLGRTLEGFTGVEYEVEQSKNLVYGRGNNPTAITKGKKTPTASIDLNQSEVEALQDAAGKGKDITDIPPFDITITYQAIAGGVVRTDVLRNCQFTKVSKGMQNDDTNMNKNYPLILTKVEFNV